MNSHYHVFLHVWKNGWGDNRSIDLSYLPAVGDSLALESNGPWYVVKHRTIVGFKAEFDAELWVENSDNVTVLSSIEESIRK